MAKIRIAGYLRVSTDNQVGEEKQNLPIQKEEIIKYCAQNNLEIFDFYIEEGVSGAKIDRPELNRMLMDAEAGKFEQVVVCKFDRLSRETFVALWIEKEFLKCDIEIISIAEPYRGNDPMTVAFRQMIMIFAQLERGRITERLVSGRIHKAHKGRYAGGRPALGYRANKETSLLDIDESKRNIIKIIFELRNKNLSFIKIANILNEHGYTTTEDKRFTQTQIKRVIDRQPLYEGKYSYAGISTDGVQPTII